MEPLLPIPNMTVKRLCADDSADSRVKVGHRQANYPKPTPLVEGWVFYGPSKPRARDSLKVGSTFNHRVDF